VTVSTVWLGYLAAHRFHAAITIGLEQLFSTCPSGLLDFIFTVIKLLRQHTYSHSRVGIFFK